MKLFSTEAVSKYHPDKYADQISDAILTECLSQDPLSHCGIETLVTFVKPRLHNMAQGTRPGEMFEELLIANFPLLEQADKNNKYLSEQTRQLTLFDYQYDY